MLNAAVEAITKGVVEVAKYDAGKQRDVIQGVMLHEHFRRLVCHCNYGRELQPLQHYS